MKMMNSGWRAMWSVVAAAGVATAGMQAQTVPSAIPVPFVTAVAGNGLPSTPSAACTTGFVNTDGAAYGDGCPATQASLSSPQGATVDKYGNIYIADYSHRLLRVIYNGGMQVYAAISAANTGFTPSGHALPSFTPTVGNIYTLAGTGTVTTALTATGAGGAYSCANNSASASVASDSLGDGCPGAGAVVGPRDVKLDADGNLFVTDYTDSRIRVFCVNCAAGTLAASLITLENAGVTPVNGAIYTIVGFTVGYRDQAPGYSSTAPATVNSTTAATVSLAELRTPSGAVVSPSDDVFIADNLNNALRVLYNGGTAAKNILTAEGYTPVQGNVYTIAGAGCVSAATGKTGSTASANSCLTIAGSDTPTLGTVPGATQTSATTGEGTGIVWSVYLDANGNVYYTDANNARVKVLYGGIAPPLTIAGLYGTPKTGYTYSFAGQGAAAVGSVDGVPPSQIAFTTANSVLGAQGVGGDANGNIFMIDYGNSLVYETYAQTGIAAIIAGGSAQTAIASGAYCNGGTTGPVATDAAYDGCPATQVKLASPRGPLVADSSGNLYFGDSPGYYVRKFSYNPAFPATAVGSATASQPYAFSFLSNATLTATTFNTNGAAGTTFSDGGGDTCTTGLVATTGAPGTTCVVNAKFSPQTPGLSAGAIELNSATGVLGTTLFDGTGNGAGLDVDPGTSTTTGATLTPQGIAVDGTGRVFVSDSASKSVLRYSAGVSTSVASGFAAPTGVAVDATGDLFVADSLANTITEVPVIGAKFTFSTAVSSPHGLATDGLGKLYVADSGNNRVLVFGAGAAQYTVAGFTGLSAPQAVAVDYAGNLYAADSSHVVKLTPTGTQTTVVSSGASALAVDAAGNLLIGSNANLVEYPSAGGAGITLSSTFVTPAGIALDPAGDAFVADAGLKGYVELQRSAGYYKFPTSPASTTIYLTSSGNLALSAPSYAQTDTTDFTFVPASANGCSGALPVGVTCSDTASFNPTVAGPLNDYITVTSNATNASPITIQLTGTTAAQTTTTTLSAVSSTLTYGAAQTLNVTITGSLTTPSSGTVNFYNNFTTLIGSTPVLSNGTATYSFVPAAGSYSVTATFVPTGLTYLGSTSKAATFTVSPAQLTVTANGASKVQGAANPALTYTVTGFVNNDTQGSATTGTPTEFTTATTNSTPGTYPITIQQGTLAATNYTFTFVNGTLSVTGNTTQTISFGALLNTTYGATPITLSASASSGLPITYTVTGPATINGSTLTITGAGSVSVTANQYGNNTYAAATPVTQSFSAAKAPLTVTASSVSRTYGAANPTLTYTIGTFVNGDSQATATTGQPGESTSATASSAIGPYTITLTAGTLASTNYTLSLVNGTLTVTPATLTLTANSVSRTYGAANPTFTGNLSGAVNNDQLTETFSTTATTASPAGTYAIVPSATGANVSNYKFAATNGTLTINQATPTVTISTTANSGYYNFTSIQLTAVVSSPTSGVPTGTVTFYANGTAVGTANLTAATTTTSSATYTTTTLPVGTDVITATYNADTNFIVASSTGVLTINIAAGFGVTASSSALAFQKNYQEAQTYLTINPGGRGDTLTFACQGLPAKLNCAFTPNTVSLSGLTTAQSVQLLISNSSATAAVHIPSSAPVAGPTFAGIPWLAVIPCLALLLAISLRRRTLLRLFLVAVFAMGSAAVISGCGSGPTSLEQVPGTYPFTVTINSGSSTLQTLNFTLTIPQ